MEMLLAHSFNMWINMCMLMAQAVLVLLMVKGKLEMLGLLQAATFQIMILNAINR
ncbi:hypothetical protein CASFOL_020691 [Castilleja foliolosa]|uniref:NADH dehydrogenase subunit 4L n=1 Tax=Castilleja foliolosa TaxID=1961234 RepID=A0ABD3D4I6_9LAMI